MHVCPFTTIGGKMLIYKHLPPILLIFSVFLFFFYRSLRPSFDKLIIRSFQHICMCLVCVLRPQTEFCLKYGDYSSIAACATFIIY